jgi:putative exosortase-associated protein (TIGR04073 family)
MTSRLRLFTGVLILTVAPLAWSASTAPGKAYPEDVFQGMSAKLVRGITNLATSPAEWPKQVYKTTRDQGVFGAFVGLFKGVGMVIYRATTGALETALFLVPEPGFYESLTTPAFVWQGWGEPTPALPNTEP